MVGCGAAIPHVELDAKVGVGTARVVARRQDDAARRLVLSTSQPLSPNNILHRDSVADPDQIERLDPDPHQSHKLDP